MLHLIGNAHIDPVWLWRWQEGFSEILATFRSALDRMNEFPDFEFTSACAVYYEWVEKTDPEMFEEIRARVKEGRWHIVGGWFLQPDCNAPQGESFARHTLISQRYFREKFGVTATVGYNVDSFGHTAMLPQILTLGGMKKYVFMRPSERENPNLADLFRWESADGSSVTAFRIHNRYCITAAGMDIVDEIRARAEADGIDRMAFVGVGNHGGGPTVEVLEALAGRGKADEVWSSPEKYFEAVAGKDIPTVKGELQYHARGCYSANTFIKKSNRQAESNLLTAEALCVLANRLTGAKYPAEKLRKAWKNLLFCQFHDIMGGCSIRSAYTDAGYLIGEIMSITEQAIARAMTAVSRAVDTLHGETMPATKLPQSWRMWIHEKLGTPYVIFNTHPWEVTGTVTLTPVAAAVTDKDGSVLPMQKIRGEQTNGRDDKYNTLVRVTVPAYGYTVIRVTAQGEARNVPTAVKAEEHALENEFVRVEFDPTTGEIARIADKTGKTLLGRCETILTDETDCDTWAHNRFDLGAKVGTFGDPVFEVTESGAVRASLRVTQTYGNSAITRTYSLCAGEKTVRVSVRTDWHEKHRALKLCFPASGEIRAANAFGSVVRPQGTGEEVTNMWFASDGWCVCSDSICAYDTADGFVRATLLRGAIYADHFGNRDSECEYMDMGEGRFSYAIAPNGTPAENARLARAFNEPLRVYADTFHTGTLGEQFSAASLDAENLVVTAIKQSEDGKGIVLRCYEANGESTDASLRLIGVSHPITARPYEIVTVGEDGRKLDLVEDGLAR